MMPGKRRERRRKRQGKGEAGDAGSDAAVAPAETPELRQQADALKEKGNTAFKAGNLTEAVRIVPAHERTLWDWARPCA